MKQAPKSLSSEILVIILFVISKVTEYLAYGSFCIAICVLLGCNSIAFIIATYLYSYKLFQSVEHSDGAIDWIKCLLHCLEVGIEDACQAPVEVCRQSPTVADLEVCA